MVLRGDVQLQCLRGDARVLRTLDAVFCIAVHAQSPVTREQEGGFTLDLHSCAFKICRTVQRDILAVRECIFALHLDGHRAIFSADNGRCCTA